MERDPRESTRAEERNTSALSRPGALVSNRIESRCRLQDRSRRSPSTPRKRLPHASEYRGGERRAASRRGRRFHRSRRHGTTNGARPGLGGNAARRFGTAPPTRASRCAAGDRGRARITARSRSAPSRTARVRSATRIDCRALLPLPAPIDQGAEMRAAFMSIEKGFATYSEGMARALQKAELGDPGACRRR